MRWKSDDLLQSRRGNEFLPKCYMCSGRIDPSGTQAERPRLCAQCETLNRLKRSASPDLSSVVAVVTGGRCKIGFATALRLLRLGATVAISTRFPRGAAGRYAREPDSAEWLSRLTIFGVDFRGFGSVVRFARAVAARFPRINLLVNNAAQTVRRPPGWYEPLLVEEEASIPKDAAARIVMTNDFLASVAAALPDNTATTSPTGLLQLTDYPHTSSCSAVVADNASNKRRRDIASALSQGILSDPPSIAASNVFAQHKRGVIDTGGSLSCYCARDDDGEPLDTRRETSWTQRIQQVHPVEFLEVQMVNVHAPWQIIQTLNPNLAAAGHDGIAMVVNVTSAEGSFFSDSSSDMKKKSDHPHTNMAKAALNMLTSSLSADFAKQGVSVISVDTGWVSSMTPSPASRPHVTTSPPLTCEDGAARLLDPIISWVEGKPPPSGKLIKHFKVVTN